MGKWATYRKRGGGGQNASLLPAPGIDDWAFDLTGGDVPPAFSGTATITGTPPDGVTDYALRSRIEGDTVWSDNGQANVGDPLQSNLAEIGINPGVEAQVAWVIASQVVSEWSETKQVDSP